MADTRTTAYSLKFYVLLDCKIAGLDAIATGYVEENEHMHLQAVMVTKADVFSLQTEIKLRPENSSIAYSINK